MADIVSITGHPVTPEDKAVELNEKQKSVVRVFEDFLSRAKAGQFSECAVIAIIANNESLETQTSESVGVSNIVAGAEVIKFRLLETRHREYR